MKKNDPGSFFLQNNSIILQRGGGGGVIILRRKITSGYSSAGVVIIFYTGSSLTLLPFDLNNETILHKWAKFQNEKNQVMCSCIMCTIRYVLLYTSLLPWVNNCLRNFFMLKFTKWNGFSLIIVNIFWVKNHNTFFFKFVNSLTYHKAEELGLNQLINTKSQKPCIKLEEI